MNNILNRLDKRIASKIEDGDLEVVLSPIIKNDHRYPGQSNPAIHRVVGFRCPIPFHQL